MELPNERLAAQNAPLPPGMSQADNKAYLSLRALYRAFYSNAISRSGAAAEKRQILKAWETDKWFDDLSQYQVKFFRAVEHAAARYRHERTLTAADELVDVIDSLSRPWIFEEEQNDITRQTNTKL